MLTLGIAACQTTAQAPKREFQTQWPAPPADPRFIWEQSIRSSADVIEETAADRFKRMATGQAIGGKALQKPYGVVAKYGMVFIGDTAGRRVSVYDFIDRRYYEIGTKGIGTLAKPLGMAIDDNDLLYVVDGTGKRVVVFELDGTYRASIGSKDLLNRPTGVAVARDGSRIYVVDTGGVESQDHRVVVFDKTGEHLFNIGTRGNEDGQFNLPLNAHIGPDGTLYVVDGGNFRVQAFNPDGTFKFKVGAIGIRSGQFARPKWVTTDAEGNIYVSDAAFGNMQLFNQQGELLMWIGARATVPEPGRYLLPAGVAVDPTDGRIYFADQYFRKVDVFRPAGAPQARPAQPSRPVITPIS